METLNKLQKARSIIKNSDLTKKGKNDFSGYDYYTPEQVEDLVYKACEETNLICLTNLKKDEFGYFQELRLVDLDNIDDFIVFELRTEMPEIKATNASQQMGGMDTYSERYLKMKVFQIKDNNLDFDSKDNRPKQTATQSQTRDSEGNSATCRECGSQMVLKSGQKNGKKWRGFFCPKNRSHKALFL